MLLELLVKTHAVALGHLLLLVGVALELLLLLHIEVAVIGADGVVAHILPEIIGLIIIWSTPRATHILRIHVHVVGARLELLTAHRHASVAWSAHPHVVLAVVLGLVVLVLLLLLLVVGLLKVVLLIVRGHELIVLPAPLYLLLVVELVLLHLHVHLLLAHGRLVLLWVEGL